MLYEVMAGFLIRVWRALIIKKKVGKLYIPDMHLLPPQPPPSEINPRALKIPDMPYVDMVYARSLYF